MRQGTADGADARTTPPSRQHTPPTNHKKNNKCLSRRGGSALEEAAAWKAAGGAGGGAGTPGVLPVQQQPGPPPGGPQDNSGTPFGAPLTGSPAAATVYSPAPSQASTPGPPGPQGPQPPQGPPPQQQPYPHQHQPFGRPSSQPGGGGYGPPPPHYGGGYGGGGHGGPPGPPPPQFGLPFGGHGHGGPHPQHGPPHHAQHQHHLLPGPPPPAADRMDQGSVPVVPRRHTPYFGQPDYRVYELNKRLQQRTEESDNLWWDAFATEFFEDDATLTLTFCLEDGPKRYTIGRTLIPRYFRSIFEGGVTELYYNMKHPKESFHNTSITLDCDQCTMVTHHGKPMFTKVCTEGRLILEFTFDDLMRVKSWHLAVRTHRELIPRSVVGHGPDHAVLDQLSKNITRQGITNSTLNYLRLCVILEPMQELMSRHKAYALSPRDCLKTTLFQKWQRMVAPPESQRPANKRRKRKGSNSGANSAPAAPSKKRSPGPNFSLASQDVMVVGEPSLMGGEFGDEDERLITRLENTQYDGGDLGGGYGGDGGGGGAWHPPGDRPGGGGPPPPPHSDHPPPNKSPH